MKEFQFKEVDKEGLNILETISKADKFNRWMFDTIYPYCRGKILEIGSGIGNISQFFIEANASISLSDIRENYCNQLKEKFSDSPTLDEVLLIDLTNPDFENRYQEYEKSFDTVFALNVVEHIEDDALALKNCHFLLKDGGTLLILVPAYQSLYCRFDRELGHFRRYTKKTLKKVFELNNFHIKHSRYFNVMGIAGWIFSGKILRKKTIPERQMGLYNKFVPVFKIIDKTFLRAFGLSVIIVGTK
jgi:2-polyprenyl-3-methyl-5-hydroxy-6-metoxy-1,4-benzoquinol methylase